MQVAAEHGDHPVDQAEYDDADQRPDHEPGEPRRRPQYPQLVQHGHAGEHGERADHGLEHDALEPGLEEAAHDTEQHTFDDGVRGDQRRVGDPGERDDEPEHQPGDHGTEHGQGEDRTVRQQQPARRAGRAGQDEEADGADDDVVQGHRATHGGGCVPRRGPRVDAIPATGRPRLRGDLTQPAQHRVGTAHGNALP